MGDLATRSGSVTYQGYGLRIDPNNVLAIPIVSGDYATTSLSSEGASQNSAGGITLIAAVQTRYNNRFVLSGSLAFFSDAFYAENPDNKVLGDQLSLCTSLLSLLCRALQARRVSPRAEHRAREVHPRRKPHRAHPRNPGAGSSAAQPPHLSVRFVTLSSLLAMAGRRWQATTWCTA